MAGPLTDYWLQSEKDFNQLLSDLEQAAVPRCPRFEHYRANFLEMIEIGKKLEGYWPKTLMVEGPRLKALSEKFGTADAPDCPIVDSASTCAFAKFYTGHLKRYDTMDFSTSSLCLRQLLTKAKPDVAELALGVQGAYEAFELGQQTPPQTETAPTEAMPCAQLNFDVIAQLLNQHHYYKTLQNKIISWIDDVERLSESNTIAMSIMIGDDRGWLLSAEEQRLKKIRDNIRHEIEHSELPSNEQVLLFQDITLMLQLMEKLKSFTTTWSQSKKSSFNAVELWQDYQRNINDMNLNVIEAMKGYFDARKSSIPNDESVNKLLESFSPIITMVSSKRSVIGHMKGLNDSAKKYLKKKKDSGESDVKKICLPDKGDFDDESWVKIDDTDNTHEPAEETLTNSGLWFYMQSFSPFSSPVTTKAKQSNKSEGMTKLALG